MKNATNNNNVSQRLTPSEVWISFGKPLPSKLENVQTCPMCDAKLEYDSRFADDERLCEPCEEEAIDIYTTYEMSYRNHSSIN